MELRSHHLLCTRAFKGRGYSDAFVQNMYNIITDMKKKPLITLIEGCDQVCTVCPKKTGAHCCTEAKVSAIDMRTLTYLQLERKTYSYSELDQKLHNVLTADIYYAICHSCEWLHCGVCSYADVAKSLFVRRV